MPDKKFKNINEAWAPLQNSPRNVRVYQRMEKVLLALGAHLGKAKTIGRNKMTENKPGQRSEFSVLHRHFDACYCCRVRSPLSRALRFQILGSKFSFRPTRPSTPLGSANCYQTCLGKMVLLPIHRLANVARCIHQFRIPIASTVSPNERFVSIVWIG